LSFVYEKKQKRAGTGRPRSYARGSEVLSLRVPEGTARLIRTGFKTIGRLEGDRANPAVFILREQESAIRELRERDPVLAKAALQAIRHVLEVLAGC
jgi:hypothetical protein